MTTFFSRTLIAGAALATALSAQAGILGQSVNVHFASINATSNTSTSVGPLTVGLASELTHTTVIATLPSGSSHPFGDGSLEVNINDTSVGVYFGNGSTGEVNSISLAIELLDPDTTFLTAGTAFDNFLGLTPNGWLVNVMTPKILHLSITGLPATSPIASSAEFNFETLTTGPTTGPVGPITGPTGPSTNPVPEPGSLALVALGLWAAARARRRA